MMGFVAVAWIGLGAFAAQVLTRIVNPTADSQKGRWDDPGLWFGLIFSACALAVLVWAVTP